MNAPLTTGTARSAARSPVHGRGASGSNSRLPGSRLFSPSAKQSADHGLGRPQHERGSLLPSACTNRPPTMPAAGCCRAQSASAASAPGAITVSGLRNSSQSPEAAAAPVAQPAANPPLSGRSITVTPGTARAAATVPSPEALSTTMMSAGATGAASRSAVRHPAISASLW